MLMRVDKNGNTFEIADEVLDMEERMIIHLYPLIHHIVDTDSGNTVWTRTMAYFEGDYDPGTKVLR